MPKTKSAKKALRQSIRRHGRNLQKRRSIAATIKRYRRLVSRGETEKAEKELAMLYKLLDKATKTGVIKENASRRAKSRLARLLAKK